MEIKLPKLKRVVERPKKKKILLLSDDLRLNSGIGTMSKEFVLGTIKEFDWVQIGAAIKHPESGKVIDISDDVDKELGIDHSYLMIYPSDGYGNPQLLREIIRREKPDAILHFTDPRFWGWLYQMEREIRQNIPIMYYNIWDNLPNPYWNVDFYNSCDAIFNISRQTHNLVYSVLSEEGRQVVDLDSSVEPVEWVQDTTYTSYIPHGINSTRYYTIEEDDLEYSAFKKEFSSKNPHNFLIFWNNRNIRRKQPGDVVLSFKHFTDTLYDIKYEEYLNSGNSESEATRKANLDCQKCILLMHTDPIDHNGTDIPAVVDALLPKGRVIFSDKKIDTKHLNYWYNMADVTINIASNEGFGLSGAESLMAGTPIINNVTGGLQDQCRFEDNDGNWISFDKKFTSNHTGVYKKCGKWAFPVFPSNRSLQGSPATPYILDDRVSFYDVSKQLLKVYKLSRSTRKKYGSLGRDWLMSKESGMSALEMSNRFIKNINFVLNNWVPVKHFTLEKVVRTNNKKEIGLVF